MNTKRRFIRASTATLAGAAALSLLLAVRVLGGEPGSALPPSLKPESQYRDAKTYDWQQRHQAVMQRNLRVKPEIVFIGDSITHFWGGEPSNFRGRGEDSWKAMVGSHTASNLGFGFDYIDNAYFRVQLGELDGISPKVIVVLLGTNNLGHRHDTPEICAENMRAFLALLRDKSPGAKILLLGILPRGDEKLNEAIFAANGRYAQLADGHQIIYADVGGVFRPQGEKAVSAELMPDKVHPSAKGYQLLGAAIKAQLDKLGF